MADRGVGCGDGVLGLLAQLRSTVQEALYFKSLQEAAHGAEGQTKSGAPGPSALTVCAAPIPTKASLRKSREDVFKLELLQSENHDTLALVSEFIEDRHKLGNETKLLYQQMEVQGRVFSEREKELMGTIERLRKTENAYRVLMVDLDSTHEQAVRQQAQSTSLRTETKALQDEVERLRAALKSEQDNTRLMQKERTAATVSSLGLQRVFAEKTSQVLGLSSELRILESKNSRLSHQCTQLEQSSKEHLREADGERMKSGRALTLLASVEEEKRLVMATVRTLECALEESKKTQNLAPGDHSVVDDTVPRSKRQKVVLPAAGHAEPSSSSSLSALTDNCCVCQEASYGLMRIVCSFCQSTAHGGCFKKMIAGAGKVPCSCLVLPSQP